MATQRLSQKAIDLSGTEPTTRHARGGQALERFKLIPDSAAVLDKSARLKALWQFEARFFVLSSYFLALKEMKWLLLVAGLGVLGVVTFAGERGLPAQEGIVNFGKVSETLYRGAQPDEPGIQNLKRLGVK